MKGIQRSVTNKFPETFHLASNYEPHINKLHAESITHRLTLGYRRLRESLAPTRSAADFSPPTPRAAPFINHQRAKTVLPSSRVRRSDPKIAGLLLLRAVFLARNQPAAVEIHMW